MEEKIRLEKMPDKKVPILEKPINKKGFLFN